MALTFLRHTRPDVAPGTCYGRTDLPLAASFERDAQAALEGLDLSRPIFSSPLRRCLQLAEKAGKYRMHPGLAEMDFGAWEMRLWEDVPRAELDLWASDFLGARPHGGESVGQLQARVADVLPRLPDGALVITHHGVIKAAAALAGHPKGWDIQVAFGGHIVVSA